MKPQRIQLSRKKGFDLQRVSMELNGLPAVNCARPSKFGNPYKVEIYGLELALELFARTIRGIWMSNRIPEELLHSAYDLHQAFLKRHQFHPLENVRRELAGHNLACGCKVHNACHCDTLLEIANA